MKNKIFQSRDLCLRALDTNSLCAKSVRRNEENMSTFDFSNAISKRVKAAPEGEREHLLKLSEGMTDIISLGRGDPDLDTPEVVVEAAVKALRSGKTHYTHWQGLLHLRELICKKLKEDNGLSYSPEEIIVTNGVQEAVMATMLALLNDGDEVIMGDPFYTSYANCVNVAGGKLVLVPTTAEDEYILKADAIRERITDKTKMIVVVSPNNPTGTLTPDDELKKIAELAIEKNLIVISDEIYEKVVFEDYKHVSIAGFPGMRERTVVFNGFSKAYSMTGWRVGYMAAPVALTGKMQNLVHDMGICVAEFSQYGAIAALEAGDSIIKKTVEIYDERRHALMEAFDKCGIRYNYPKAGLYMWVSVRETGLTSYEFAEKLLLEGHVQLFPGTIYGDGEGYVRVSLLAPTEDLKEAARRIEKVFSK